MLNSLIRWENECTRTEHAISNFSTRILIGSSMVDFDWTLLPSITKYLATGDWEIRISELEKKTKFNFDRVFADTSFYFQVLKMVVLIFQHLADPKFENLQKIHHICNLIVWRLPFDIHTFKSCYDQNFIREWAIEISATIFIPLKDWRKVNRTEQDSNLRGKIPSDF